jgi:4,5-dihydroxyphthalate decarboxylase
VLNVFNAFVEANERVRAELAARLEPYLATGTIDSAAGKALGAEILPYGVAASRTVLETVSRYVFEDGLTTRRMPLEEIFSKQTLEL